MERRSRQNKEQVDPCEVAKYYLKQNKDPPGFEKAHISRKLVKNNLTILRDSFHRLAMPRILIDFVVQESFAGIINLYIN